MRRLFAAILCVAACVEPVNAQRVSAIHVRVDNDFFAMRFGRMPLDFDYTSGLELALEFDRAPGWVSRVGATKPNESTLQLAVGQRIYTPRSRGVRNIPGERPFAGWLYGAAVAGSKSYRTIQRLRVEVGVTGPPSLAQETQSSLHDLVSSEPLPGWDEQLPTEPGFSVQYDADRRVYAIRENDYGLEIRPGVSIGLGTVWSGASAGTDLIASRGGFSLFAGFQGEWVWRNEFLDGTAFRSSERTAKIPIVGQFDYGASFRSGQIGVTARFVVRSREYHSQPSSHLYGSLIASLYF